MAKYLVVVLLVVIASVAIFASPAENVKISKGQVAEPEAIGEAFNWNSFKFDNEDIFSKSAGPCGWASSAPACSAACYYLGWGYYTYWYASGQCCCS